MTESVKGTILYVGNFQLPDKGASANRVVSNGKIFNKLGFRTVFLGVKDTDNSQVIHGVDVKRHMYAQAYPKGTKEWFNHMISVKNMEIMAEKYDDVKMIILYNAPYTLLLNAKRVFNKKGIKVVYDCTEWTGVTEGSLPKRAVKKVDEYFIRNWIHKKADGLIVISSLMEEGYRQCENMIKIPPLVDMNEAIWQADVKKEDTFEFLFAGMLDGNKESLDTIVEAYGRLEPADMRLRIIGVREDEFCSFYEGGKALLEKCKNEIIFMGLLSHEETVKYVGGCDCYVFIRQSDVRNNAGFPTKFAEACTCGAPVITTDISDVKGYMTADMGQVLDAVSADAVEEAMSRQLSLGKRSKWELKDTFHFENYVRRTESWIKNIFK